MVITHKTRSKVKKTIKTISAFVVGVSALCACGSDFDQGNAPTDKVAITFSATQEISGETSRTVLGEDKKVNWQSDDVITIWDGTAKNTFSVSPDETDATKADISGTVTAGAESFVAVYPNSVGQNCEYTAEGITGLVIPTTQTATAGSFDPNAAIMVGETTGENLNFKHVCSFLKITTAAEYTKIVVSTKSAYIAGTFNVMPSTGKATVIAGSETVTLKPASGASSIAVGTYYIAVAPFLLINMTVKCYNDDNTYIEKKTEYNLFELKRAVCIPLGEVSTENGWKEHGPLLSGEFSVSDTKKVKFTKSNLRATWDGTKYIWGFAEDQSSFIGNEEGNTTIASQKNGAVVDLFGWSTSETYYGVCAEGINGWHLVNYYGGDFIDWGGLFHGKNYFTLSKDEWSYLLNVENNTSGARTYTNTYTWAMVNRMFGLLIFPDNYNGTTPVTGKGIVTKNNNYFDDYPTSSIPDKTWEEMESAGVVFLPAAGYRNGSAVGWENSTGAYWSSTADANEPKLAHGMGFGRGANTSASTERFKGRSVRLVKEIK